MRPHGHPVHSHEDKLPNQTILVVDDEADLRDLLREHLSVVGEAMT